MHKVIAERQAQPPRSGVERPLNECSAAKRRSKGNAWLLGVGCSVMMGRSASITGRKIELKDIRRSGESCGRRMRSWETCGTWQGMGSEKSIFQNRLNTRRSVKFGKGDCADRSSLFFSSQSAHRQAQLPRSGVERPRNACSAAQASEQK
jgi:hypothetical protein